MLSQIKQNKIIRNMYMKYFKARNLVIARISPKLLSKIIYKKSQHKDLDLKNPKLFNEKLMYIKLNDYNKNDLVVKCSDKYSVREYIKEMHCDEILNELYGVYDDANEIEWEKLPEKFVIKCNHGCGFNIICTNKDEINKQETIKKLNKWKKQKFGYETAENHYTKINPKIICEKYLETDAGLLPNDYKIYCFNGEPKLVLTCTDRANNVKLSFLDLDWKFMDIGTDKFKTETLPEKPQNFDKMLEYAKKLSKPFKFVRVDFYNDNGKVIFGELTFTPAGCNAGYYNEKGNQILGDMLEL